MLMKLCARKILDDIVHVFLMYLNQGKSYEIRHAKDGSTHGFVSHCIYMRCCV